MRIVFGVLGLVIALAIVGMLAKQQLRAVKVIAPADSAASAPVLTGTPAQQSRQLQRQVTDDVNKALQQGVQRDSDAEAKQ